MGSDGSAAAAYVRRQGGLIWTQRADSCACPSMPDSLREGGYSSFSGDPRELAAAWSTTWPSSAVNLGPCPVQDKFMSQAVATQNSATSLTGLLMPLTDRTLLLPNVAVAELIPYRAPQVGEGCPAGFSGRLPGVICVCRCCRSRPRRMARRLLAQALGSGDQCLGQSPGTVQKFIAVLVRKRYSTFDQGRCRAGTC